MIPTIEKISMVRGDTLSFDLTLPEIDDETITSIFFTAKKKKDDIDPLFQKSLTEGIVKTEEHTYRVRVSPEDTYQAKPGEYQYDLQIGIGSDIYTPLMGTIDIIQDVTVMQYALDG